MTHDGCVRDSSRDPNPEMTHLPMLKQANFVSDFRSWNSFKSQNGPLQKCYNKWAISGQNLVKILN